MAIILLVFVNAFCDNSRVLSFELYNKRSQCVRRSSGTFLKRKGRLG